VRKNEFNELIELNYIANEILDEKEKEYVSGKAVG